MVCAVLALNCVVYTEVHDVVPITSINQSFICLPSFGPAEGHSRMNTGYFMWHMIHSNVLALTLMPRQLNFPLHSRSENIVNHSRGLNKVLNYQASLFQLPFISLDHFRYLAWVLQRTTGDFFLFSDTILLLFQPHTFWWWISRIA